MERAAKIISYIFHPLLMPTIGILLIFNTNTFLNFSIPTPVKLATFTLLFLTTFFIPVIITLLLLNQKFISSLEMETTKERIIPYGFTIIFYFFTLYLLRQTAIPQIVINFVIASTLSIIFAFIVNFFWKISAHLIGLGGLLGATIIIGINLNTPVIHYVIGIILITGFVASARLLLKAHNITQIIAGFVLGFLCQFFVL